MPLLFLVGFAPFDLTVLFTVVVLMDRSRIDPVVRPGMIVFSEKMDRSSTKSFTSRSGTVFTKSSSDSSSSTSSFYD